MRKILAFVICALFLTGSSNAELVISTKAPKPVVGDYLQYEMIGMVDSILGDDPEEDIPKYLRYSDAKNSGMRMEVVDKKTVGSNTLDGENGAMTDYFYIEMSWEFGITIYYDDLDDDGDGEEDTFKMSMKMESKTRYGFDSDNGTEVSFTSDTHGVADNRTSTSELKYEWTLHGPDYENGVMHQEQIELEVEETEILERISENPDEYKVGDKWTTEERESFHALYNSTITRSEGTEYDSYEYEDSLSEEVNTVDYEALREVEVTTPAGTFNTIEVREDDRDKVDSGTADGNETLTYFDGEDGVEVKMVSMSYGEVSMEIVLKEGKWGSMCWGAACDGEDLEEIRLPGLSFMISMVSVALIAMVRRIRTI